VSQDLRVALTTGLNDKLVGPLRRTLDEVEKNFIDLEKVLGRITEASQKIGRTLGTMPGPTQAARQVMELSRSTQNALSLAEKLKSAWSMAGNTIKGVTSGVAAFQTAKYVMGGPLKEARTYDRQLRDLGNTAYGELSGAQFTAKVKVLDDLIVKSLQAGGGTREGAVGAASTLMAQGGLSEEQLAKVMPTILKAATAANADPKDIANVVAAALKNGFNVDQMSTMIGKAIASGQAGGFEMKDMAKWLPKLLAAGSSIGMTGMKDFEEILALSQVSRTTSGGSDEAGNNLLNFLLKVNSHDTQLDAKKNGVDLSGTLAKNRDTGMSAATSFLALMQREMDKDPRIVKLRGQYAAAGNDGDRVASLKAQEQIFSGSAMGKYLQDRQALMPAIGALNNPAELKRQLQAARDGGSQTMDRAFGNIADGSDFKVQQKENAQLFALTQGLGGVNDVLGKLAEGTTELYQKYPAYAVLVNTASWAIGGLTAAATAAGGVLGVFSLLSKGGAAVEGAAVTGGAAAAARAAGATTIAAPAAAATMGLTGGAAMGSVATGGILASLFATNVVANNSEAFAGMGADAGDTAFAAAIINASKDGSSGSASNQELISEVKALGQRPIVVQLDGREIASSVNEHMNFIARRN
jgi:Phage-related minor tail protein